MNFRYGIQTHMLDPYFEYFIYSGKLLSNEIKRSTHKLLLVGNEYTDAVSINYVGAFI